MSLILEALRKSEAERRRGQAPDLFTELPPVVRQRDVKLSRVLGVVLATMVLVGGAWLLRGMWSSSTQTDAAMTDQPHTAQPEPAQPQPSAPRPVASDPVRDPMPAVAARVVDTPATVPVAPSLPSASRPAHAAPRNDVTAPDVITTSPAPELVEPQTEPSRVAAPVTTPTPAFLPPITSAKPLRLTDLTVEQRKQLPPLRMSMHMWDQDPARRFVIIDGERRGEGDRIGEAVLEQISADGVLLEWNGLHLRLSTR